MLSALNPASSGIAAVLLLAGLLTMPALGQSSGVEDNTRAVRATDTLGAAPATPPLANTPEPIIGPRRVAPAVLTPAPILPPAALVPTPPPVSPPVADVPAGAGDPPSSQTYAPASAATGPYELAPQHDRIAPPQGDRLGSIQVRPTETEPLPTPEDLQALSNSVKVANPAEVSVEILPGAQVTMGARMSFRVSSKKPGYLILVDADAAGKLTQIFPNPLSLLREAGNRQAMNFVRPGRPLQIPNPADALAGFEFVASAPTGTAMVVAILSDRPVQLIDLPDLPADLTGQAAAVDYLTKFASELRIPNESNGRLLETRWSFDVKFYAIR